MGEKGERAKDLFLQGYNCSQAVAGAYADDLGLDISTVLKLSSGFGGGVGRLREVCGAVSGMAMVIGMKYGYDDAKDNQKKKELYKKVQQFANQFKQDNGSIVCRDLLGLSKDSEISSNPSERTEQYYKKRPCAQIVKYAADLIEEELK